MCYMTSALTAEQLQIVDCEQVLQQRLCEFLSVCAYAHVSACMVSVCVSVCAHVATNVSMCAH